MPHDAPTISVVIPAYNAAPFVAETLESVFGQSSAPSEVIVVNDGSPDTPELEAALAPYADRIVYVSQTNAGPSAARNRGVERARGEYVAFLDSDDAWMPEYLAEQRRVLRGDPSIDLLYSNGVVVGDPAFQGRELMTIAPSKGQVTFESLVAGRCTVLASCIVARRDALLAAGLFDTRFRRSEDFHLWARLAFHGRRICYHRRVLVRYRRRPGSLSDDRAAMSRGAIEVFRDLAALLPLDGPQRRLIQTCIRRFESDLALDQARQCFIAGDATGAAAAIRRAARHEPNWWRRARFRVMEASLRIAPRLMRRTYGLLRGPVAASQAGSAT